MGNETLYLVDGSGFIFRAYHSLPPLTRPDGTPVGAVYGFVNMLLKLTDKMRASHIAVIFDAGRKTFRNDIYSEYKAHRPPPPEDLIPQFAIVREATIEMGLPAIESAGFEADDIIATYAKQAVSQGMKVVIVSSDKDLMQLVDEDVIMHDPIRSIDIGIDGVMAKFGVLPDKVVDVLALAGDSSDNVPGVAGIGPKTAAELINQYGDLESILANAANIPQKSRREKLIEYSDIARISKRLVELKCDVENIPNIDELTIKKPDYLSLKNFLEKQGFKSIVSKISEKEKFEFAANPEASTNFDLPAKNISPAKQASYKLIQDIDELKKLVGIIKQNGFFAFDTETTSLNIGLAELVGIAISVKEHEGFYIPLGHGKGTDNQISLLESNANQIESVKQINLNAALDVIREVLESDYILKIGHNIKYDIGIMLKYGISIQTTDDTMLMSYILATGLHNHNLDELAELYLGHNTIKYEDVTGKGKDKKNFSEITPEQALNYAAEDADITLRLWNIFSRRIANEGFATLYQTIERPLIDIIANMEQIGIAVDKSMLARLSESFSLRLAELEKEIYSIAGKSFNIASPKQLGEILFDELKLPAPKKTKMGAYETGVAVLESLADEGHEMPRKILDWRQIAKLKSTYSEALINQINSRTGRVHTSFSMATTNTGRLSSNDPNLQNIPIRTEEGRKIRKAFIAKQDNVILSADYSQIELRLLAHIAEVDSLRKAFQNNQDIHSITASEMFGVSLQNVNSELRRKAKTINFGIIYGISAFGLAARLGISRTEASEYIAEYFKKYAGIKRYMDATITSCRQNGYVETIFGRKCYIKGINDKNGAIRSFSERAAINAPLQGSAADIIKRAMIKVSHKLNEHQDLKCQMILQVHDELLFELPHDNIEKVVALIKPAMESSAHLSVPLTVETGYSTNWDEAH